MNTIMHIDDLSKSQASARAAGGVDLGFLEHGELGEGSHGSGLAGTAVHLGLAGGVLADKLTLGLGALRLVALPVTLGLFADGLALGAGGLAMGHTVGGLADGHTLRAVFSLTGLIRALDFTFRLLTLHIADGVSGFLAGGVASGGFADGVADGGALGVITLPGTLGVALGVVGV